MMEKLCLVEDDPTIRELVGRRLRREGYAVDEFASAEKVMGQDPYDFYILDVMLEGDASGLDLTRHIRKSDPHVPVLILSALSEPSDRVQGLKIGADDYLGKPFEMDELLLRVSGMLRRRSWYRTLPEAGTLYEWDDRAVDFISLEARNGERVYQLSQKEAMLMKLFIEHEGEVLSRDTILDKVWGYDVYPSTRTVDNFLVKLRKYFEQDPANPKYLQSVRGLGYRFQGQKKGQI